MFALGVASSSVAEAIEPSRVLEPGGKEFDHMSAPKSHVMVSPPTEFDLAVASEAKEHFEDAIQSVSALLAIDLRNVTFMDSSALAAMIAAQNAATAAGGEVALVGASERIIKLLEITGTTQLFRLVSTEHELTWVTA
jgi:anti-sigma B factor antagonist